MKRIATTLLFSLLTISAFAQDPAAQRDAIDRLGFLVGEWSGEAWVMLPDGSRIEMNQTERVTRKVDGLALAMEGVGRDAATDDAVFQAFATVFYDAGAGEYRMYGGTSDGRNGEMVLSLLEDGLKWSPKGMESTVRYTITMSGEDEWLEKGEYSTDGEAWTQFFEMTLHKTD